MTWANCKGNGGRGGKIDYGCLTYHYKIINGNEAGHGYYVNVPFDNSSLGGGGGGQSESDRRKLQRQANKMSVWVRSRPCCKTLNMQLLEI